MAKQYPKSLSPQNKRDIINRRGGDSDRSGKGGDLEIHHQDRRTTNNKPDNLVVLTKKEHRDLHKRAGR